ncbi:MAG TPA: hypothetical protein VFI64_02335, partial [Nitrososphaeraceae archaeon]|nr:hypothetical protein [Nitrososphaeraceae archaeon]
MKNNLGLQLIGNRTALILSLFALSAFSFHLENDILAESHPFILFDPFEKSSSSPLHDSLDEICNDGQDNNGDGLVDENCGSESITKIVEDSVISHQNASIGTPLPESEICNDGQDNNGDGLVDENCSNSQTSKESDDNHPPAMPQ